MIVRAFPECCEKYAFDGLARDFAIEDDIFSVKVERAILTALRIERWYCFGDKIDVARCKYETIRFFFKIKYACNCGVRVGSCSMMKMWAKKAEVLMTDDGEQGACILSTITIFLSAREIERNSAYEY